MGEAVDRTRRVIDRASWGWTPALDAEVRAVGWEAWLDQQLDPGSIDDGECDALLAGYSTLTAGNAANLALVQGGQQQRVLGEVLHATTLRMLFSRRQLFEVLVDLWTNHFNVLAFDRQITLHLKTPNDRDVHRAHALGRFADLLLADTRDPAMLVYLDNWRSNANSAEGVNENFSRETLELHTLGILDGHQPFGQDDVVGLATVLSGWSINYPNPETAFEYRPYLHGATPVSLLDGAWTTPGRSGAAGEQDGVDVLDLLAHRPETARHVAYKLARRFVSDDPPDALLDELAQVYLDHDTAIAPVVRALFHSDALVEAPAKYRRGLDAVIASVRATGAPVDPDPVGPASGAFHLQGQGVLDQIGQPLFRRPAPDGYPEGRDEWLSSNGTLKRWLWNGVLGHGLAPGMALDADDLLPSPPPATAGALVDAVATRLLGTTNPFPEPGFDDVPPDHPFHTEIAWMADAGVSGGYPDGTFRPGDPVTRQAMAAFLHRLEGEPAITLPDDPAFTDVPADHPFRTAIEWMAQAGISTGYADGTFRPGDPVTRQAMAAFLHRLEGEPAITLPDDPTFTDVPADHPFRTAIEWMAQAGISTGYADGTFRPGDRITRQAMAAFLFRLAEVELVAPLDEADRAALVAFLGSEDTAVTPTLLSVRLGDLVALVLSTPTFQHR